MEMMMMLHEANIMHTQLLKLIPSFALDTSLYSGWASVFMSSPLVSRSVSLSQKKQNTWDQSPIVPWKTVGTFRCSVDGELTFTLRARSHLGTFPLAGRKYRQL
ncbi:hypothetical protein AVEN_120491-1 [Araneus ventricosus]|uniref:Uncharacterized protein n=1 Tax=Araneus ventricosus TaxID=182803 RepID=A0A4Y2MP66_ARAVE|nr:hypothetical protein AVEN_120491-1 [Araneus ventricosus]